MQAFIAESVIHTLSKRHPEKIYEFAGYYGQALHYSAFAVSSLITPSVQNYITSKWLLIIASTLFAVYYLGFIHVTSFYFYLSQVLMGIGYSCKFSSTTTEKAPIFPNIPLHGLSNLIRVLKQLLVIAEQFKFAVLDTNVLLLTPFFAYMGLITSFLMSVYPTTLSFTASFSDDVYIIPIYSMSIGAAEIFGGIFLRRLIKKCQHWGLVVTITTHFVFICSMLILVQLSVPEMSTIEPTAAAAMLIRPSRFVVIIIGFLLGLGDFTITTGRAVICQVAAPDFRMQVFSLSRVYQCVSSCIVLFLTPVMGITSWTIVLAVGLAVGATTFAVVARKTANNRKHRVAATETKETLASTDIEADRRFSGDRTTVNT
ncbi:hypothetical protein NECAME_05731 [Necator americanus]|uniref:Major facilitator superfamily associated domain-containing protein n=1 Tax=Necator americanus TaxID=51031 RepID=W2U0X2_NECAM|nr:hypothetical protein NECAME_05731 [Necator americanus]ETN87011.1 hypothetical protein NECAME_05731 [Necator americanus]